MTEFDDIIKSLADENEVPKELNIKLKNKIKNKYRFNKLKRAVPASFVACLVVGVILFSAINNKEVINTPIQDNSTDNGVVISSEIYSDKQEEADETVEKINKEYKKSNPIKNEKAETPTVTTEIEPTPTQEEQIPEYSADIVNVDENGAVEEASVEEMQPFARASGGGSSARTVSLYDHLEGNEEKILLISERIKEKILSSTDGIEYFEDFSSITGNERFYLTEENELVIIFEPGFIASEENGEIYFNVGIIN